MAFSTAVRSPSDSATRASHEERNTVSMTDINQAENSTQVQPPRDLESGNCTDREVLKSWETRFHEFFFRKRSQEELMNDALSTTETLIERPRGYPQLAAFQSRKTIFSIYRSFDYLRSRAILELQDQLRVLEEDLERLDVTQASSEKESERNRVSSRATDLLAARREFRERQDTGRKNTDAGGGPGHDEDGRSCSHTTKKPVLSERAMILEEIQHKLSKYDKLLVKTRELAGFRRPTLREKMNLRLWVWRKSPFSYEREELFVHLKSGLITLKPPVQEFEPLEEWVEAVVARLPKQIRKHWYEGDTKNSDMPLFKDSRIQKSAVMIVVLVIISLLAVAVLVMYRMTWQGGRSSTFTNIGLLIGFSLSFSATMGFLTGAKRAELFAATAAYCAVLIVFIGNFNNNEALASP